MKIEIDVNVNEEEKQNLIMKMRFFALQSILGKNAKISSCKIDGEDFIEFYKS